MAKVEPQFSTSSMSASYASIREAQDDFFSNRSGPYTAPSGITNAFQMLSAAELEAIGAGDVVKHGLSNQSHIEYLYESIWYPGGPTPYYTPKSDESYISLTASSMVALSRGNVTLRSTSMGDLPNVNPNVSLVPHKGDPAPSSPSQCNSTLTIDVKVLRAPCRPCHRHRVVQIPPQDPGQPGTLKVHDRT